MADPRITARRHQALLAVAFLTRLPVARLLPMAPIPLTAAAWAFPLAGLVVGGAGAAVLALSAWAGLPPVIGALLAVGVMIRATGALHEDGLADFADGAGGNSREQRLEIMRDSHIGSYGVLALLIATGLRVAALMSLPPRAALLLVGVAMASRAGMVAAMRALPPARTQGLGHAASAPPRGGVAGALALGLGGLGAAGFATGQPVAAAGAAVAIAVMQAATGLRARRMLGGQTGDVLGAIQQLGEIAGLLALVLLLNP